jgi:transposase-like protein
MPRTRPPYRPEFREQIVALVRAGRTPEELARDTSPASPPSGGGWPTRIATTANARMA